LFFGTGEERRVRNNQTKGYAAEYIERSH